MTDTTVRQAVLSIFVAGLLLSAGCMGVLTGDSSSGGNASTSTSTSDTPQNRSASDTGTDLRSATIPETAGNTTTYTGELDTSDPKSDGRYYEPIQIAAVEGQRMTIVAEAEGDHNPEMRVVDPTGNVSRIQRSETSNTTGFLGGEFSQSGRYTFEVTSVAENDTFNYTLSIERVEGEQSGEDDDLFEDSLGQYNETEQYLHVGQQFGNIVGRLTDKGDVPTNATGGNMTANATGDYLIITYEMPSEYTFTQRNELDSAFQVTYEAIVRAYEDAEEDSSTAADSTWVPEIIFFRAVDNETGELLRTTFYTKEWSRQYNEGKIDNTESAGNYYSTERWGPASELYDVEGFETVADNEFPQVYHNHTYPNNTTLAEEYGL